MRQLPLFLHASPSYPSLRGAAPMARTARARSRSLPTRLEPERAYEGYLGFANNEQQWPTGVQARALWERLSKGWGGGRGEEEGREGGG